MTILDTAEFVEQLRALVLVRDLLNREIDEVEACWDLGVNRFELAAIVRTSRSDLYRRHGGLRSRQGPPQAVTCDAGAKRRRP